MAPGIVEDVQHAVGNAADFIATKSIFPDTADSEEYARALDAADPLRGFRDQFIIPSRTSLKSRSLGGLGVFVIASLFAPLFVLTVIPSGSRDNDDGGGGGGGGGDCIYLCGNSLGLQPRRTAGYVQAQLDTWASVGVGGHFTEMAHSPLKPWQSMADFAAAQSCGLVGARPGEVAVENTLTVNLHLLMASFYRPTPTRHKVLLERKAFPSDHVRFCLSGAHVR
jgi:kynureninase